MVVLDMFLITQLIATEALGKNTLQIGNTPPAVFLYSWVSFHKYVSVAFEGLICAACSTFMIDFVLAHIKLETSEAYLPKLEKNLS